VTSDAIDWVPEYWQVSVDDTSAIARAGRQLVTDPDAAADGLKSLEQHNSQGLDAWGKWVGFDARYKGLSSDPFMI